MTATAFIDVHVVPMDANRILDHRTVIVRGGRIVEIGETADTTVPSDAERIEARGYYLMPGLADMHVHYNDPEYTTLFLANGVTTVRNMWGYPVHVRSREAIAAG